MFTISTAKRLFALTAVLLPFDVYLYGQNIGWGAYFTFGRYVNSTAGTQFLTPIRLYELRGDFDPSGRLALSLWLVAATIALAAALYVLVTWGITVPLSERQSDRLVGGAFLAAGGIFILSRVLLFDFLLVSSSSEIHWFSVPVGAVYMLFVGAVFYLDLFQAGMDTDDTATPTANKG